jgi:hypothetical protein
METPRSGKWAQVCVLTSVICFFVSLPSNAYCMGRGTDCTIGFMSLIFGVFQLATDPVAGLPWLANPLLIIGWFLVFFSPRRAVFLTAGALLCALMFLGTPGVMSDEGGAEHQVNSFEIGYWLWLASCALALFAALISTNTSTTLKNA